MLGFELELEDLSGLGYGQALRAAIDLKEFGYGKGMLLKNKPRLEI